MLKQLAAGISVFLIVLSSSVSVLAATSNHGPLSNGLFRYYPGFVHKNSEIKVVHDKGLVIEFVINCPVGWGMITLSKVEGLYCLPDHSCTHNMNTAIGRLCR